MSDSSSGPARCAEAYPPPDPTFVPIDGPSFDRTPVLRAAEPAFEDGLLAFDSTSVQREHQEGRRMWRGSRI